MCKCLVCGTKVKEFMNFGKMPIANGFITEANYGKEEFFDLKVGYCPKCHMVQLTSLVEKEKMFNENYAFFSSTSKRMEVHFKEMAYWMMENYLGDDSFVVEIGSNDGIMLQNFAKENIKHVGVEPSANVAEVAKGKGLNTLNSFFDKETAEKIRAEYGQADIITGTNVMCHIPYIHSVFDGVEALLKPSGVLVFEDPYIGDIVKRVSYDQIYDEHAFYFSACSVSYLAKMHGLELIDVYHQNVHGGSMRYVVAPANQRTVSERAKALIEEEQNLGLHTFETYMQLAQNIEKNKNDLLQLLKELNAQGKRVVGYGATSKSTTVINYCGITPDLIEFISDTTPIKQNKMSPGMHIPVRSYEEFKNNYPDYALLFAWNHGEEVMEKEDAFKSHGGKFILYVDGVRVYK